MSNNQTFVYIANVIDWVFLVKMWKLGLLYRIVDWNISMPWLESLSNIPKWIGPLKYKATAILSEKNSVLTSGKQKKYQSQNLKFVFTANFQDFSVKNMKFQNTKLTKNDCLKSFCFIIQNSEPILNTLCWRIFFKSEILL